MSATPQDVQGKLDAAVTELLKGTSAPAKMVAAHGPDPSQWPPGHLKNGFASITAARAEAGQLLPPPPPSGPPKAAFIYTIQP